MEVSNIPLLSMLKDRMAWLSQRQNVLSQNVANADTPGYVARDLKPVDFEQALKNVTSQNRFSGGLMTDDPHHIAIASQSGGNFTDFDAPDVEANPSGNSVSLEQEMIKVSDTQAQFQAATNLYAKTISMMKTAIGRTGM
ncbi:MAG: flagellar basal body rod protein FlgB [Alphaproteobacteria bacterium]|nr:flagellar basal body rod protein FlgB [Alphaproteobacteria bacterium]MDE2630604.1 flagellar basal body rod protein FlgB [Alphaproteobacteria bacterium]